MKVVHLYVQSTISSTFWNIFQYLTCPVLFSPLNNVMGQLLLLIPFYRCRNRGWEGLRDLPTFAYLSHARARCVFEPTNVYFRAHVLYGHLGPLSLATRVITVCVIQLSRVLNTWRCSLNVRFHTDRRKNYWGKLNLYFELNCAHTLFIYITHMYICVLDMHYYFISPGLGFTY